MLGVAKEQFLPQWGHGPQNRAGWEKNGVGYRQKLVSPRVATFQCKTLMNYKFERGLLDHYENTLVKKENGIYI